jgi:hypothetical protein
LWKFEEEEEAAITSFQIQGFMLKYQHQFDDEWIPHLVFSKCVQQNLSTAYALNSPIKRKENSCLLWEVIASIRWSRSRWVIEALDVHNRAFMESSIVVLRLIEAMEVMVALVD